MKRNGYTLVELLVVIVTLGIIVFFVISKTSYAFKDHKNEYYESEIHLILRQAREYGSKMEALKEEESIVITVKDLVENGYLAGEENTYITAEGDNLTDLKIKISYDKETEEVNAIVLD